MRNRVVAHPDRPGQSLLPDLHKRLPRFVSQLGDWPVNEIQVHVLETEFASAPLESPQRRFESLVAVPEFRGDEDLVPGDPALSHGGPYVSLVRESGIPRDRKSTRLNSSHLVISYAVFCLKKKTI